MIRCDTETATRVTKSTELLVLLKRASNLFPLYLTLKVPLSFGRSQNHSPFVQLNSSTLPVRDNRKFNRKFTVTKNEEVN